MNTPRRVLMIACTLFLALGTSTALAQDNDGPPPFGPPNGDNPPLQTQPVAPPSNGEEPPSPPEMSQAPPSDGTRPPAPQAFSDDGERPSMPQNRPAPQNRPSYSSYNYTVVTCSPTPRLEGETQGEVAQSYSSLRQAIGSSVVLTVMPGGAVFDILDGPVCSGAHYWYQVSYNGLVGWVTEGMGSVYWLEPVDLD